MIKKILTTLLFLIFNSFVFAADEKPGRFFEDQPDVTDDYQIHFNYLLAADSEDREMDINGRMEKILLKLRLLPFYKAINKVMKNEQRIAEQLSNIGDKYIIDQQYTDKAMKEGNVNKAAEIQTQNLLKYNNN